jgi:hypothetical protein
MLWMETMMIAGLALAMAAVVALIVGPLGDVAGSPWEEDSLDLETDAWSLDHNI